MGFDLDKKNILSRMDKSQKGGIDTPILDLCTALNTHPNFVTTSSCSGRIVLLSTSTEFEKTQTKWEFISHEVVDNKLALRDYSGIQNIWFRYEGAILHVKCRDLDSARTLVNLMRNSGFKRAGIMSMGTHPIVEMTSSESINTPLVLRGKLLVKDDYLNLLVSEGNSTLQRNHTKLDALATSIKALK